MANVGNIFIISAPSGAGKTTLCKIVCKRMPHLVYSVSYTTRAPRRGEVNGIDYYFISNSQFQSKMKEGEWVEWAKVHGNLYGTSSAFLEHNMHQGKYILLDVNVEGAESIAKKYPDSVTIFLMPPSLIELEERLKNRGTDDILSVKQRLFNAQFEIKKKECFKYIIVNDDLQESANELIAILEHNSLN